MKKLTYYFLFITSIVFGQCPPIGIPVDINGQAELDAFIATYTNCTNLENELFITGDVTDLSGLDFLETAAGIFIDNTQITEISNFGALDMVYNTIQITNNSLLETITGFENLQTLSMVFSVQNNPNLTTISGFNNATSVEFWISVSNNPILQTISGFQNFQSCFGFMAFNDCPLLTSIPSFNNLITVGDFIQFFNIGLSDISGFENLTTIGGGIEMTLSLSVGNNQSLSSISAFCSLEELEDDLLIQDNPILVNLSGLKSLRIVGQTMTIRNNASLATLNGLQSLEEISRPGYEGTDTVMIHDNPMLSDCDPLCNVLTANQIIGNVNLFNNLSGCNAVSEINMTNCVPFQILDCTALTEPIDGAIDVAIDTNISWDAVVGATYYIISIGTTSGGVDIANRLDLGNQTTYDLPADLPQNTEIFVKVVPHSDSGNATCCEEESFTTEILMDLPTCTTLTMPLADETNVSISTDFSWNAVSGATGYKIAIGTNTVLLNAETLGDVIFYDLPFDLPANTEINVEITPFNATGDAIGCILEWFTTGNAPSTPSCTTLTLPLDQDTQVSINTNLEWSTISDADSYIITIGTSPNGTEIADMINVGNTTTYNPTSDLPENSTIYVSIIPVNSVGEAQDCIQESFKTEDLISLPDCTNLQNPFNGQQNIAVDTNISWNAISNAEGYSINIGTNIGSANILDNEDVGNKTTIILTENLPESTEIFVTIIPYNSDGEAINCVEESFITERNSQENPGIVIPKFFTPNNDGDNDVWLIQDTENQVQTISIFNRYGKLLKTLSNGQLFWDGTYNNQIQPVSDYWFNINLLSGENVIGHFTLKR